ncbi:MAG: zinc-ribbon domain-containing protein, partial [Pyrinomonadaceae bacterium]
MSTNTCQNCGREYADSMRVCRYCGTNLLTGRRPPAPVETGYAPPPPQRWETVAAPAPVQPYASTRPAAQPAP